MNIEEIRWKGSYSRREKKKNKLEAGRARRDDQHQLGDMSRTRIKNRERRSGNLEGTALGEAGEERRCVGGGKGRRKGGRGSCFEGKGHREEEKTRDGD